MVEQYSSIQQKGWTDGFDISDSLNTQTKSINQSVSGLTQQQVNPIKSTMGDVKSGLALIKEKDREFIAKIHSYKSETIDNINNYLDDLTGGRLKFEDFGKVITYKDGFNVNKDQLMNIANRTLGFNIKNLPNEVDSLASEFLNELNSMTLGLSDGLFDSDGNRVKIAGDWDRTLGENVFSFLTNSDSSFKTIRNFSASNAVLNVMVRKNANIGFVDGFKAFGSQYLYESDYHAALINAIPILLNNGDVDSLAEVLSILGKVSVMSVAAKYPLFAETILTNFRLSSKTPVEDYLEYGKTLITIIETVLGENWLYSSTFMGDIINLGLVYSASQSSINVIEAYIADLHKQASELSGTNKTQSDKLTIKANTLTVMITLTGKIATEDAYLVFKRDFPDSVTFE